MNIETANRLYELRKKNGYSQEELAEKLGLSRQAVSKWERAEASPDTDNLIELAKLYNVTLDELVNAKTSEEYEKENRIPESLSSEEEKSNEQEADLSSDEKKDTKGSSYKKAEEIVTSCVSFISIIVYLCLGFCLPDAVGWKCYWVLFLLIPVSSSIVEAIYKKRFEEFCYPVLVTAVYCFIGLRFSGNEYQIFGQTFTQMWHPFWIIFVTIPLYYTIAYFIDQVIHKGEASPEEEKEPEEEE